MTLRSRLVVSFAAVLLVLLLGGAATVLATIRRDEATTRARVATTRSNEVESLRTSFLDQESGYRGYVVTGEATYLEPYLRGRSEAVQLQQRLHDAAGDVPEIASDLAGVRSAAARWYAAIAPDIALVRAHELAAAQARLATGRSKSAFAGLRTSIDRLADAAHHELHASRTAVADARGRLTMVGAVAFALVLVAFVVVALLVHRWVTRPIDALARSVEQVHDGDLDHEVELASPPELAALAANVDAMRRRLVDLVLASQRAREAIEQNAAVALTLGTQTGPVAPPLPDGWSIAGELRPAEGLIAGDTYDLVALHDARLGVVVVDIAGHGAVAGIAALRVKELVRAALALGTPPGEAIGTAADQLDDLGEEVLLSAFVAVVDPASGAVSYANAGHPPAFRSSADADEMLDPTGPILGAFPGRWTTAATTIEPGEDLVVYTDGLTEARGADRQQFGETRLRRVARPRAGDRASTIATRCLDAVVAFNPERRLRDDATIVVLHRAR